MNPETETQDNEPELSDSVDAARSSNLRETNPELYGEEKAKADEAADDADAKPDADKPADDDAASDEAADKADKPDEAATEDDGADDKQHIPRARLNEVVREKKDALAERDALQARIDAIESAEKERTLAAEEAAKAPARDIDAEIDAVIEKYEAGDLDEAEKRAALKPLERDLRKQLTDQAVAAAVKASEQRDSERSQQTQAAQWEDATAKFMADPLNAAYKEPIRIAALNEAMKVVDTEAGGKMAYAELLQVARDRVEVAFGGAPSSATETSQQKVTRERRELAAKAAAGTSVLPDRPNGGIGTRGTPAPLDTESISRAEWRKLSQAQKDEALGKTPA